MAPRVYQNRLSRTVFFLSFNLLCSVIIVLLNKWVYVNIGFPNLTLTLLHFVTTFIGLCICEYFNVFKVKVIPIREVLLLAATFCGFVIFTNLSLQHNTVGTFQIAKFLTTPAVIVIQLLFYRKTFTFLIKCTLVPIALGVIMNFYYDIKFNYLGTVYAILGVLVTSLYQVLVNEKQHELQMDPMQLLYYQSPISSAMLIVIILLFEPPLSTLTHGWTVGEITMVFLSCVTAFFVNISIYWIIGNTSPLTYNMIGHLKFCLTVIGGYMLFREPISMMQGVGVLLTILGVTSYAHLKLKEQSASNQKSLEEG
ncbi:UNVERIFIED_CONTAM: hypothetical protein PYX00_009457 [Menopon gallinae]|uniref:Sugar phosphate transporter domain-containing protein n=1 Tax=Menopon gallinae TaxID=328185 RepID=A0AAW2HB43_9NEOP